MKQLTTSSLKQGYITIPRALLNRQATDGAAGETEAFLQILAHTNYSDVPYDINGTIILCKTQSRFTRNAGTAEKYLHALFPLWGFAL